MEDESSQLVFTTRDPLLSSSNVAMTVTCNISQTVSSVYFSTPLNSPLLSPSTPLWSPVSFQSPSTCFNPQEGATSQTLNSDEDFQTPEVLGEIVIGEEESEEEDLPLSMRIPGSGSGRARTPRTINRLLEQHRTSERNRHHDLNATINHICSGIPGYSPYVRETKIIKLQRIINYICHVESYIHSLCDEMGVTLDFKNIFLSSKTSDLMDGNSYASTKECPSRSQFLYEPEAPIPYSISKKMKRRSPTVECTIKEEEEELEWLKNCSGLDSPDASILTPDDCDQILSSLDVAAHVTVNEEKEESRNDRSGCSSSVPTTPFTGIYDSSQASQRVPIAQSYHHWPGKRSQRHQSISEEACVPTTPVTPLRRSQRRRVLRSPLLHLASLFKDSSSECEEDDDDEFKCTAVPHGWDKQGSNGIDSKSLLKSKKGKSKSQVDHRKTSWMNGFMMYSRIHRRRYIRENPGVHTSHISKLMGHDWRAMTAEQQKPYKEKAGVYTKQFLIPPSSNIPRSRSPDVEDLADVKSSSTISHLVPCFRGTTEEPAPSKGFLSFKGFCSIEPPATMPFVSRERDEGVLAERQETLNNHNGRLPSEQLDTVVSETKGDFKGCFTKLSSSPSKRSTTSEPFCNLIGPPQLHAVRGDMADTVEISSSNATISGGIV